MNERTLSNKELDDKETIVKSLKKKKDEFKNRYGDRWKEVMYATATKIAKEERGAGEEGTPELRRRYEFQTPGQEKKMKFKDLKDKLNEYAMGFEVDSGEQHDDVHYLEHPGVRERLNSSMSVFSQNPSLDVWQTMTKIRVKLNSVGLEFVPPRSGEPQPVEEYALSGFGGRWGWDSEAGEITSDDGIEHRAGDKYVLRVNFESTSRGYMVDAQIHRVEEFTEDIDDAEETEDDNSPFELAEAGEDRELELYINNDAQLFRSRLQPIQKNLITKMAQGKFNPKLAIKAFMYVVDEGAKNYVKEFDAPDAKWNEVFDKKTRLSVATSLAVNFKDEADDGNYDDLLPKKYRS